jgi:hypothetical protein
MEELSWLSGLKVHNDSFHRDIEPLEKELRFLVEQKQKESRKPIALRPPQSEIRAWIGEQTLEYINRLPALNIGMSWSSQYEFGNALLSLLEDHVRDLEVTRFKFSNFEVGSLWGPDVLLLVVSPNDLVPQNIEGTCKAFEQQHARFSKSAYRDIFVVCRGSIESNKWPPYVHSAKKYYFPSDSELRNDRDAFRLAFDKALAALLSALFERAREGSVRPLR